MDRKPFVSVNSVRAFLPPDSCASTFHGGFRCFPGRRRTRTEVTVFTEGLTDIELAGLSDRIHGTKHVQSGTLYLRGRDKGGRFTYGWPPEDEKPHEQKRDQGGGRNREEFGD